MPTSAPGSRVSAGRRRAGGFTLIEVVVVLTIVAISAGLITLALRDGREATLEREALRLATLLESARVEARASGVPASWVLTPDGSDAPFRFVGQPSLERLPRHWLDARVRARIVGAGGVVLGPEPILPDQRVRLQLEDRVIDVHSDGLLPFAVEPADPGAG